MTFASMPIGSCQNCGRSVGNCVCVEDGLRRYKALVSGSRWVMWRRSGIFWEVTSHGYNDLTRQTIVLNEGEARAFAQDILAPDTPLSHDAVLATGVG